MHWCLQNNIREENCMIELKEILTRNNISWSEHKIIPFIGEFETYHNIDTKNVICFGSYSMRHIAKKQGWTPGVFDLEGISYGDQITHWGNNMLNHDAVYCKFSDVMEFAQSFDVFFMRPIYDTKEIAGAVYNYDHNFKTMYENIMALKEDEFINGSINKNTELMLSKPKNILREYRFVVVNSRVITGSQYKIGNRVVYSSNVDQDIYDFAQARVNEWQPKEAFVLDIALLDNNVKKIVEINTVNAAGLYACDMNKVVGAFMEFSH